MVGTEFFQHDEQQFHHHACWKRNQKALKTTPEHYEIQVSNTMNIAVHANVIIIHPERRHKKISTYPKLTKI